MLSKNRGHAEWTGDWCDSDPRWTKDLKDIVGLTVADDGLFWMSFEDMLTRFYGMTVCMQRQCDSHGDVAPELRWIEERFPFTYNVSSPVSYGSHRFEFEVSNECDLYVTVHQRDQRCVGAPAHLKLGITILKKNDTNGQQSGLTWIASESTNNVRQCQLEMLSIKPGSYLCIPTTTDVSEDQRGAVLSFHATDRIAVTPHEFNNDPTVCTNVVALEGATGSAKVSRTPTLPLTLVTVILHLFPISNLNPPLTEYQRTV